MKKTTRFGLGQRVRDGHGFVGTIDAVFVNLKAAIDCGIVNREWLSQQEPRPKTPSSGIWYSIIGRRGAVLGGEKDIAAA